jgi:hypothetical protein
MISLIKSKIVILVLVLSMVCGCASLWGDKYVNIPSIGMPADVVKPEIKSHVVKVDDGKTYIAYEIQDGLKLLKFMVEQEALIDKLKYRITIQDGLIKEWGQR